jgi:hypothetical protein
MVIVSLEATSSGSPVTDGSTWNDTLGSIAQDCGRHSGGSENVAIQILAERQPGRLLDDQRQ